MRLFLLPYILLAKPFIPKYVERKGERERGGVMKETSKVIMVATLVMVVSLAIVLGMILVLLAELYCTLLLRRRQLRNTNSTPTPTASPTNPATANISSYHSSNPQDQSSSPSLSSFYAQGVLEAPRRFLFPAVPFKDEKAELKKQKLQLHHQLIDVQTRESNSSSRQIGLESATSPPPSFMTTNPPKTNQEVPPQSSACSSTVCPDKTGAGGEHFVYISNPIYDSDASRQGGANTPFETPDTSPSRLERSGSSGDDQVTQASPPTPSLPSPPITPPLTPMKKLPPEACSVSFRDTRSLGTSDSDSISINGPSSSSTGSPCTSPSW